MTESKEVPPAEIEDVLCDLVGEAFSIATLVREMKRVQRDIAEDRPSGYGARTRDGVVNALWREINLRADMIMDTATSASYFLGSDNEPTDE